jgi:hypothetical protein
MYKNVSIFANMEPLDIYPLSQILMADMQAGKLALPFK